MKRLLSCEFNFDTVCVELKFSDGTMIAIDTIAVENEVAMAFPPVNPAPVGFPAMTIPSG